MTIDYAALAARAAAEGKDMTQAQKGGGGESRPVPAAGTARLRFIEYIEVGKHEEVIMGKPKTVERAYLTFELSGKNYPPIELGEGRKVAQTITFDINVSLNEKAHFFKLFNRMNYAGDTKHIVGLLGRAFKGTIIHRKYAKRGEDKSKPETWTGVAAELFNKATSSYTIEPPRYELVNGPEHDSPGPTGQWADLPVDKPTLPLRAFIWNYADKAMWDSIFIDGEWPAVKDDKGNITRPAESRNKYQNEIKAAKNFKGSAIEGVLVGAGVPLDLGVEPEVPGKAAGSAGNADPLAGIVGDDDIPF